MQEKKVKISNPDRIVRILTKASNANLQIMMRTSKESSVVIRGKATIVVAEGTHKGFYISNISERGMDRLNTVNKVQVELTLMSTKLIFLSNVLGTKAREAFVSLPESMISIERRSNARYMTVENVFAYAKLQSWTGKKNPHSAPPVFNIYPELNGFLKVVDVSVGGLCLETRFPAMTYVISTAGKEEVIELHLPLFRELKIGCQVRWMKKIIEHIKDDNGRSTQMATFRVGYKFTEISNDTTLSIKQFIQQLSQAEAI